MESGRWRVGGAAAGKLGQSMDALLELTEALAAVSSMDELYAVVLERVPAVLGAEKAVLFRLDEGRGLMRSRVPEPGPPAAGVVSGDGMMEIALPLGSGVAGHVGRTGEVVNATNCLEHPLWLSNFARAGVDPRPHLPRTGLAVPVRDATGKVVGVLQASNKLLPEGSDPAPGGREWPVFTEADERIARAVAASAAMAMQNIVLTAAASAASAAMAMQNIALEEQARTMFYATVDVLSATLGRRDPNVAGHSMRVAATAEILAKELALPTVEVEKVRIAGLLHDVGKMGVPEGVLHFPGRLTDDMRAVLNGHAAISREILEHVAFPPGLEDIPLMAGQHHERLDGSGFPDGLVGAAIVPGARILGVADVYDALRVRLFVQPPKTVEQALAIVRDGAERGELDATVVAALERAVGEVEAACGALRAPETREELRERMG